MKTAYYKSLLGKQWQVTFDDLQVQEVDRIEHTVFYTCTGYDELGRIYTGVSEFTCDEFEGIMDIEMVSHMHHNRKPYQARVLLKSISHWQSVVNGEVEPKRPIAYYKNKLSYYHPHDIEYLQKTANNKS